MRGSLPWIAATLVVIGDRVTKSILLDRIEPGGWVEVFPGLAFTHVHNRGIAFSLFADGVEWIEQKTGKKVFGVLPWYNHINIEPEDSVVIEQPRQIFEKSGNQPVVGVIRLPHISNFNDFDPLKASKG